MNLDELERRYGEAQPGLWSIDFSITGYVRAIDDGKGEAVCYGDIHKPTAQFIVALHKAFPELLALARDGERHRMARTLFSVEDVETALRDSENFVALEEENLKYDAAIDAAMKERT